MSGFRLPPPWGRWIDRTRPLHMQVNGECISGFVGDTLATALLAAGRGTVARSFKLHRPRGLVGSGADEPNALFDLGEGANLRPVSRATEVDAVDGLVARSANAWPGLRWDLASLNDRLSALLPAGFYYKTFRWPDWHRYEPTIRRMAGLGRAPVAVGEDADADAHEAVSMRVEVLVVGAGAAGLAAADAAARTGRGVLLLEAEPESGGWLAMQDARSERVRALRDAVHASGVDVRLRTTAVAVHDHRLVTAVEQVHAPGGASGRPRLLTIRCQRLVLATGAMDRPMLFPGNDRPGVMLAGAAERHAWRHGVAAGRRAVLATACDAAYATAAALQSAGVALAAIVDRRDAADIAAQPPAGVPWLTGSAIVATQGRHGLRRVRVAGARTATFDADLVLSQAGFTPDLQLFSQAGGRLRWCAMGSMFVPEVFPDGVRVVGAAAGAFALDDALAHAQATGSGTDAEAPVGGVGLVMADTRPAAGWLPRRRQKTFVDLQNDVATSDIELAARENYRSVEHLKRYTTNGMATDQGKTSNVNALVVLGAATARTPPEVGTTRFRPPFKPVPIDLLVGHRHGHRLRPLRRLPAHDFHAQRGALFEEFGGWLRPAAYPRPEERLHDAATREATAVRRSVGLFDASPLGKLEVIGPDAGALLDRLYVGTMSTLAVGSARYGLVLDEHGVVVDDGIVTRLAESHFWLTTTSSGAARTAAAFEEWLQTEWPELDVSLVPVTAQWATIVIAGPRAWSLLDTLAFDLALAPSALPHMAVRPSRWNGTPLRVMRASFSGELGYEIYLPPSRAVSLWQALAQAGKAFDATLYGVEALMMLRLEKGFIDIGVDTDGTTMPQDLDMARGLAKKAAHFVGRRSLLTPAGRDPQRLQLVGLKPCDRRTPVPVGAQIAAGPPPSRSEGHVTSSAQSPALGEPIALAMLRGGRQRMGERLQVWHLGRGMAVEVVPTPFLDPNGDRLRG